MNTLQTYAANTSRATGLVPAAKTPSVATPSRDKWQSPPPQPPAKFQLLHIKLEYWDGGKEEINLTSPFSGWVGDLEMQHIFMRQYLDENGPRLGIRAYQSFMGQNTERGVELGASFPRYELERFEENWIQTALR
ncbi:hypothetical protein GCM10028805_57490 [Spirosoma harenae]